MYLKLKSLISLIAQSTKESSITQLLSSSNIRQHLVVEFKCKEEESKYVLGYIDFSHKGETCLYILYSEVEALLQRGSYQKILSGIILSVAADENFDKYKIEYYIVTDKFQSMLDSALDDYFK